MTAVLSLHPTFYLYLRHHHAAACQKLLGQFHRVLRQIMNALRVVLRGKLLHRLQDIKAHLAPVVVHGDDHTGTHLFGDLLCLRDIQRVGTADRDQKHIAFPNRGDLLRAERVPQIAQMHHGDAFSGKRADRIPAALGAVCIVVEACDFLYGERRDAALSDADLIGIAMVEVRVAAVDSVSLPCRVLYAGNALARVEDHAVAAALEKKTGVSQPGNFHGLFLPFGIY